MIVFFFELSIKSVTLQKVLRLNRFLLAEVRPTLLRKLILMMISISFYPDAVVGTVKLKFLMTSKVSSVLSIVPLSIMQ